jgi:hypothetical protein
MKLNVQLPSEGPSRNSTIDFRFISRGAAAPGGAIWPLAGGRITHT